MTQRERDPETVAAVTAARSVRRELSLALVQLSDPFHGMPGANGLRLLLDGAIRSVYALEGADSDRARAALAVVLGEVELVMTGLLRSRTQERPLEAPIATVGRTITALQAVNKRLGRDTKTVVEAAARLKSRRSAPPSPAPAPEASKAEPQGRERRSSPRVAIEAEVGFQTDSNFFTGYAEDLSDGGLFVATYDVLPIGTELSVSLTLPGERPLEVKGRVAWTRETVGRAAELMPGMGVRLEELSPAHRELVLRFLRKRPPMFHDE